MIVTFQVLVGSGSLKLNDRVVQSSKLASDASMYTENKANYRFFQNQLE